MISTKKTIVICGRFLIISHIQVSIRQCISKSKRLVRVSRENESFFKWRINENIMEDDEHNPSRAVGVFRPAVTYVKIITEAIESSPDKKLTLVDIYQYAMKKYDYFTAAGHGWKVIFLLILEFTSAHLINLPIFCKTP